MAMTGKLCVAFLLAVLAAGCCSTRNEFDVNDCYGYPPCSRSASIAAETE